ncbi:hypothetical protein JA1_000992 [Spathaspora sp. JA1]|nr:hypothetical protein JA1_000992 [Spathaspora sp. JA1]
MPQDDFIYRENRQRTFEEPITQSWGTVEWKEEQNMDWVDELVNSGFYYAPTQMDKSRIVCAYCNGEEILDEIPHDLDVSHVHAKKGGCSWSIARVAMVDSLRFKAKRSLKSYWKRQKHTILNDPLSQEAIEFRRSFYPETYPLDIGEQRPNSRSLAEAGFIYSPIHLGDDRVTCIYCGCSLDYWENGDDPIKEHKKNEENEETYCYFLDSYTEQNKKKRRRKPPIIQDLDSQPVQDEQGKNTIVNGNSIGSPIDIDDQDSPIVIESQEIIDIKQDPDSPIQEPETNNYENQKEMKSTYVELDSSTILSAPPTYKMKGIKRIYQVRDLNEDDICNEDMVSYFVRTAKSSQENHRGVNIKKNQSIEVRSESFEHVEEEKDISSHNSTRENNVKVELEKENNSEDSAHSDTQSGESEESGESQPVLSASEDEVQSETQSSSSIEETLASASDDDAFESFISVTESDDDYIESENNSEVIELNSSSPERKPKKRKIMGLSPQNEDESLQLDDKQKRTRKRNTPEQISEAPIPKKLQKLNLKRNQGRNNDSSFDNVDYGEENVEQLEKIIITSKIEPLNDADKEKDVHVPKLSPIKFTGKRKSTKSSTTTAKFQPSIFDVSFDAPAKRLTLGKIVETKNKREDEKVDSPEGAIVSEDDKVSSKQKSRINSKRNTKPTKDLTTVKSDGKEQEEPKHTEIVDQNGSPPSSSKSKIKEEQGMITKRRTRNNTREDPKPHISLNDKQTINVENEKKIEVVSPPKLNVKQSQPESESESEATGKQETGAKIVTADEDEQILSDQDSEAEALVHSEVATVSPGMDAIKLEESTDKSKKSNSVSLKMSSDTSDYVSDSEFVDGKISVKLEPEVDIQSESDNDEDFANYLRDMKNIDNDIENMFDSDEKTLNEDSFQTANEDEMDVDENREKEDVPVSKVSLEDEKPAESPEIFEDILSSDVLEPSEVHKQDSVDDAKKDSVADVKKEETYTEKEEPINSMPVHRSTVIKEEPKQMDVDEDEEVVEVEAEDQVENSILKDLKSLPNIPDMKSEEEQDITPIRNISLPMPPGSGNDPITSPLAMCSSPMPGSKHTSKGTEQASNSDSLLEQQQNLNGIEIDSITSRNSNFQRPKSQSVLKWEPKPVTDILAKMSYLQSSAEEVKKLANLSHGLHDDVNGDLTRFIGEMPEEEEIMTIKEWIEHCATNCYDIILQNGEETRQFLKEEYLRAIAAIEALPTDD